MPPRTEAKFGDGGAVDVRAYGADPSGGQDSTAAIQAALDDALKSGRGNNRGGDVQLAGSESLGFAHQLMPVASTDVDHAGRQRRDSGDDWNCDMQHDTILLTDGCCWFGTELLFSESWEFI